jgi:hypothetical protein
MLVINLFHFPPPPSKINSPESTSSPEINQFNQRDQFNQFDQFDLKAYFFTAQRLVNRSIT